MSHPRALLPVGIARSVGLAAVAGLSVFVIVGCADSSPGVDPAAPTLDDAPLAAARARLRSPCPAPSTVRYLDRTPPAT